MLAYIPRYETYVSIAKHTVVQYQNAFNIIRTVNCIMYLPHQTMKSSSLMLSTKEANH